MDYLDNLKQGLASQLKEWETRREYLQNALDRAKDDKSKYSEAVQQDMKLDEVTEQTAVNDLNRRRAALMIEQAEKNLNEQEPLFTPQSYDAKCNEIRAAYKGYIDSQKVQLIETLNDAVKILDEINSLKLEADECVREVRKSAVKAGIHPFRDFSSCRYSSGTVSNSLWIAAGRVDESVQDAIRITKKY